MCNTLIPKYCMQEAEINGECFIGMDLVDINDMA